MSRLAHLPVIAMVAAIAAGTAWGASAMPVAVHAALSPGSSAAEAGVPERPSVLIGTGDFNRDGIADVVKTTAASGQDGEFLTVLPGSPAGGFTEAASGHPIGKDPRALLVGDFNRDGNPDVIVGDGDGSILEFLGDGKGHLEDAGKIGAFGSVVSIAAGHFTHDGNLDLVVSDSRSNSAVVLLGAGDGSFRQVWSFRLPMMGREFRLAAADFNGDGIADIAITGADDDDDNFEVMLGNGNGTFTYAPQLSHVRDPNSYCPS